MSVALAPARRLPVKEQIDFPAQLFTPLPRISTPVHPKSYFPKLARERILSSTPGAGKARKITVEATGFDSDAMHVIVKMKDAL